MFLVLGGVVFGGLFASGVLPPDSDSGDVTPPEIVTRTTVVKVQLSPDARAELRSPQGEVEVLLETGAVDGIGQLWYRPLVGAQIPELPIEFVATETVFELSLFGSPRVTSKPPDLIKHVFITVRLSENHVATAAGVDSNVVIQRYNEENAGWSSLPTAVDFTAATARVAVRSLSIFALTIRAPSESPEPVNGQADSQDSAPSLSPTPVSTTTPIPTVTPVPSPVTTLTPTPGTTVAPSSASTPAATATAATTTTPTSVPTATPTPVFDGIYVLTVDQPLDQSYSSRTITFRIGNLLANETATWQEGETIELNLTALSTSGKHGQVPLRSLAKAYSQSATGALLASPA